MYGNLSFAAHRVTLGRVLGLQQRTTASSLACQTAAGTKLVLAISCSLPQLLRSGAFHHLALMQTGRLSWNTVHDLCSGGVTFLLPLTALPAGVSLDARSADFIANASSCQEMVQMLRTPWFHLRIFIGTLIPFTTGARTVLAPPLR